MFRGRVSQEIAKEEGYGIVSEYDFIYSTDEVPSLKQQEKWFEAMLNGEFDFFGMGIDTIKLNDMIFQFLADPDDGYRSYMGSCRILEKDNKDIFFRTPITKIRILSDQEITLSDDAEDNYRDGPFSGYYFVDVYDNHIWGRAGTDYKYDYYPCFCVQYFPKPPPAV